LGTWAIVLNTQLLAIEMNPKTVFAVSNYTVNSPKVGNRISTILDITDVTKNSLLGNADFTKFDYHENFIVNNTKS